MNPKIAIDEIAVVDPTGGAPEQAPALPYLVEGFAPLPPRLMLRANLLVLVASFPPTTPSQGDSRRGPGVTETGFAVLKKLNAAGTEIVGLPPSGAQIATGDYCCACAAGFSLIYH